MPEELLGSSSIPDSVPVITLGSRAAASVQSFRPSDAGPDGFTEIDLADVDKQTGEVASAQARRGRDFNGTKTPFAEGELLFARIRPSLNNVVIPGGRIPTFRPPWRAAEWIRLQPDTTHTLRWSPRGQFRTDQLKAQVVRRVRASRPATCQTSLCPIRVRPTAQDPPIVKRAMAQRLRARRELDAVAAMYVFRPRRVVGSGTRGGPRSVRPVTQRGLRSRRNRRR